MEQLDLFSSKPTTETFENKEVKKPQVVSTEKPDFLIAEQNPNQQLFDIPDLKEALNEEPIAETVDEIIVTHDAVVFFEETPPEPINDKQETDENVLPGEEKLPGAPQPSLIKNRKVKERVPQKRGRKSFAEINAEVDLIDVPDDETLFKKQYYSISEVAGWFNVNTSLLRFWETEFDVLKPRKNRKGDRMFRPEDVKNLQLIYHLLRDRKYTIDGAKDFIKGNKKKADTQLQLTQSLQKFKSFLLELKANLQ